MTVVFSSFFFLLFFQHKAFRGLQIKQTCSIGASRVSNLLSALHLLLISPLLEIHANLPCFLESKAEVKEKQLLPSDVVIQNYSWL